jgi:hypothetical protein
MVAKSELANTLFPLGFAEGPAFCNRDEERERLKANILGGTHTYIMGVRRYGKTSLVRQVARELSRKRSPQVHTHSIDLFTVHTLEALDALLRDAVGKLSAQFLPKNKRILGRLGKIFAAFKPELTISDDGVSLKLFSESASTKSIQELLEGLDQAAVHYKRRAVLIIDEFQQIAQIDKHRTIEGSIRNVAQGAKGLSFVFLGSERSLLAQMFEGPKRPLFNSSSERMDLERISADDYRGFLQNAARLRWSRELSNNVIESIIDLTDRHASYVNILCRDLWRGARLPSSQMVHETWKAVLKRERHQAYQSMMALAHTQRTVLQALAIQPTGKPTAKDYLTRFNIAGSTMTKSIDVLMEKDFVRLSSDGEYEVIDPLVKGIMSERP